ncbi:MAG TPA: hypothetical protein VN700_09400 [Vicinamibacterales bacterium]|nr:hypothetical protein [Vicinamibacterales bacterium]
MLVGIERNARERTRSFDHDAFREFVDESAVPMRTSMFRVVLHRRPAPVVVPQTPPPQPKPASLIAQMRHHMSVAITRLRSVDLRELIRELRLS